MELAQYATNAIRGALCVYMTRGQNVEAPIDALAHGTDVPMEFASQGQALVKGKEETISSAKFNAIVRTIMTLSRQK